MVPAGSAASMAARWASVRWARGDTPPRAS